MNFWEGISRSNSFQERTHRQVLGKQQSKVLSTLTFTSRCSFRILLMRTRIKLFTFHCYVSRSSSVSQIISAYFFLFDVETSRAVYIKEKWFFSLSVDRWLGIDARCASKQLVLIIILFTVQILFVLGQFFKTFLNSLIVAFVMVSCCKVRRS